MRPEPLPERRHSVTDSPWPFPGASLPTHDSMISFTPDARFTTVHYDCYRDRELVLSLSLPFIGWAVVLERHEDDPTIWYTRLVALGLDAKGAPITPNAIAANFSLHEGQVIQTRLIGADGAEVVGTANPDWESLHGLVPTNEAVDDLGDDDLR